VKAPIVFVSHASEDNPDKLPRQKVLQRPATLTDQGNVFLADSLAYEPVMIDGREYWLPDYYVRRDELIGRCPKCPRKPFNFKFEEWWDALERRTEAEIARTRSPVDTPDREG
jgi:hypothetical protein